MQRIIEVCILTVASCIFVGMAVNLTSTIHVLRSTPQPLFGVLGLISIVVVLALLVDEWDDRRKARAKEREKDPFGYRFRNLE